MEENISAPLRAQQAQLPTMAQQTPQVLTRPQLVPQVPLAPQVPQGQNGQRHAQEQVCVFPTGRRYHRLTCGIILEEYEEAALQKPFKEAADLVVNAVPLNLVRPFGVTRKDG